jgi:hypothetical protein
MKKREGDNKKEYLTERAGDSKSEGCERERQQAKKLEGVRDEKREGDNEKEYLTERVRDSKSEGCERERETAREKVGRRERWPQRQVEGERVR